MKEMSLAWDDSAKSFSFCSSRERKALLLNQLGHIVQKRGALDPSSGQFEARFSAF